MSAPYFSKFPIINYDGKQLRNLTIKVKPTQDIKEQTAAFLPYQLLYNQKLEDLAYDYYGDPNYFWLVAMSNDVIDPYYDWLIEGEILDSIVETQYGSVANAMSTVLYYNRKADSSNDPYGNVVVNTLTYQSGNTTGTWTAVDAYTEAINENDKKRTVYLINNQVTDYVEQQMDNLINGNV